MIRPKWFQRPLHLLGRNQRAESGNGEAREWDREAQEWEQGGAFQVEDPAPQMPGFLVHAWEDEAGPGWP